MKRIIPLLIVAFILIGQPEIKGQEISIYANSLQGIMTENNFAGGSRGISVGINYLHPLKDNLKWLGGMEFNSVSWGNNVVANIGLNYSEIISNRWTWSATAQTQQGVALFKPSAFYSWGMSAMGTLKYRLSPKSGISISTGLRFYNCPEYAKYSQISNYLDFPIEIAYHIHLSH